VGELAEDVLGCDSTDGKLVKRLMRGDLGARFRFVALLASIDDGHDVARYCCFHRCLDLSFVD